MKLNSNNLTDWNSKMTTTTITTIVKKMTKQIEYIRNGLDRGETSQSWPTVQRMDKFQAMQENAMELGVWTEVAQLMDMDADASSEQNAFDITA
jgi:hypothetical protein